MAKVGRSVSLVAIFIIAVVDATAGAVVEPPSSACPDIISSVIDCLSYIANGSIAARPSKACCVGIASVIKGSSTVCLCDSLKEATTYGVPINMTRILGLPVACSVDAPTIDCSDHANSPSTSLSPSHPPAPSAPVQSPSTPSPATQVSAPTPTETPRSSEAPKLRAPLVAIVDLAVAFFIVFFLLF